MTYPDRYHLTPEQSRFLAKKKWDENVYCGMKMENRAVTFPQTKTILEGVNVPGVQIDDIQAILNMRDAWRFLIGSIDEDVTLEYVCKLNGFIARNEALEWGKLRTGSVAISGTDYTPPVPQEAAVRADTGVGASFIKKSVRGPQWAFSRFFFYSRCFCRPFRPSVYQRRRRQRASARHRSAHKRQAAQKQARGGFTSLNGKIVSEPWEARLHPTTF